MKYRYLGLSLFVFAFCIALCVANGTKDTARTENPVTMDEKGENTAVASEESERKVEEGEFSYFHD
ncbi:MAG: hypothetical protein IJL80_08165, partial [Treponema sp.]|nr:hypothetical protein [Treponema sp.]